MKLNMYSLYDMKTTSHGVPFFMATDAAAVRAVSNLVSSVDTLVGMNPEDFRLHRLASFDDGSGEIDVLEIPVRVCDAIETRKPTMALVEKGNDND